MPYILFNLQLFGEEGGDMAGADTGTGDLASPGAENVGTEGVATGSPTEQVATADGDSWESLIKGKYKDDYNRSVKDAVSKRFKNQRDLQGQIDSINPIIQELARKYNIAPDGNGRIDIKALSSKVLDDDSLYEQEAFQKGMTVSDLKQMKSLERENQQLKAANARTEQDREWAGIMNQSQKVKEMYPNFDFDAEMQDPNFSRLFTQLQKSGFPDAVKTAYEVTHKDQIMGGAMQYGVQKAQQKLSQSVQANLSRPAENGMTQKSAAHVGDVDPSKLTKAQIADIKARAARGERITFA